MTAKEIYNHNWFVGEKIWAIVHKYAKLQFKHYESSNEDFRIPVEVKELTVKLYERHTYGDTTFVKLEFDLPDNVYTYMDNIAPVDKTSYGRIKYNVSDSARFYQCKFFTKEDAEKQFPIEKKKCLKQYKDAINKRKSKLEEYEDKIKNLEYDIEQINREMNKLL